MNRDPEDFDSIVIQSFDILCFMRRSHCREPKEVVSLLYRQEAHNLGKGMIMGKVKDILQLLVAWQDVVIQLQ